MTGEGRRTGPTCWMPDPAKSAAKSVASPERSSSGAGRLRRCGLCDMGARAPRRRHGRRARRDGSRRSPSSARSGVSSIVACETSAPARGPPTEREVVTPRVTAQHAGQRLGQQRELVDRRQRREDDMRGEPAPDQLGGERCPVAHGPCSGHQPEHVVDARDDDRDVGRRRRIGGEHGVHAARREAGAGPQTPIAPGRRARLPTCVRDDR